MAWIFQQTSTPNDAVNVSPATGGAAVFVLKQTLKQAGWVVRSSSDGTTYNSTGDQITTGSSGAGGMSNTNAWFRIQSPAGAGGREFTFQRGTTGPNWRIKLSHSSGFTGGSPGATQTPSATDEQLLIGAGSDAAPTFTAWLGADATYKVHCGADNAAPYDHYALFAVNATGVTRRWWMLTLSTGSYPTADVAPYVITVNTAAATHAVMGSVSTTNSNGLGQGFFKKGLAGEAFTNFRAAVYAGTAATYFRTSMGVDPYAGRDVLFPVVCGRITGTDANSGWKGAVNTGTLLWQGTSRSAGDYVDVGSARYAYFDEIAIRWPTGVIPVL